MSGPKRTACTSVESTSPDSSTPQSTSPDSSPPVQSVQNGLPSASAISHLASRASSSDVPVARRTACVAAVSESAKTGKSAGCDVLLDASHSPRPSACAGSHSGAPSTNCATLSALSGDGTPSGS